MRPKCYGNFKSTGIYESSNLRETKEEGGEEGAPLFKSTIFDEMLSVF